ncbi:MAG: 2-oxo acid dehydrogenase subunit E2 [Ruminococcaceae bacterium]|nr:2-oxo acid dehydrogenase subunit E2 [Oscillospiraceae bacterium]
MRADGKKVKGADPMYAVAAHIMSKRSDSMNMITLDIPIDPINNYLNEKRKEGKHYSHLSVFITALVHTIAEYPALNRFVVNKTIYARNELAVGMVVLKGGKIDSHGTMNKIYFKPGFNLDDVENAIQTYIEENRKEENENGTDKIIRVLTSIPGLVRVAVCLFKGLDKFGLLPKSIIDMSPFHISVVVTNLASIRTNHIYHHIYDFGTTSLALAMGNLREVPKRKKGEVVFERCMPIGLVMDERIASGSYFALAFRKYRKLLEHPELLEKAPDKIKEDN